MYNITSERLTPSEYINFLKRTDLGSQYPKERFNARIERLLKNASISLAARDDDGLLIGALLGQGLSPMKAAGCGVYIHGLAGDLAAAELGEYGMLPSDMIAKLPLTLKDFSSRLYRF